MATNLNTAPLLFDRALLRVRQARAEKQGAATFLLDRVADDMAERLHAVLREFAGGADIGTPDDQVRNALAGRVGKLVACRFAGQRIRAIAACAGIASTLRFPRWPFSSSTTCPACWRKSAAH